jgi:hypothetical protein
MLALSPEERLLRVQEFVESAFEIRELNESARFVDILRLLATRSPSWKQPWKNDDATAAKS